MVELNAGQQVTRRRTDRAVQGEARLGEGTEDVDFVDALPRSPVGKVLKKDLRAKYWQNTARRI